ncbi:MAG: hypothetical protein KC502_14490 [Myxococcales bacterium]|nr:hypothetical protein [Myxococcales bacterium]
MNVSTSKPLSRFVLPLACLLVLAGGCGSAETESVAASDVVSGDGEASDGTVSADATAGDIQADAEAVFDAATSADAEATPDVGSGADAQTADDTAESDAGPEDAGAPTCTPTTPPTEVCDGVDNDCDGVTDDGGGLTKGSVAKKSICDDGDKCNGAEACKAGKCQAGAAMVCGGKACNDATCDKVKGCVYTPNTKACSDGNKCTTGDTCTNGACVPTANKKCDDGNKCTTDTCSPATGSCTIAGTKQCNDNNPCTTDTCDKTTGACKFAPIAGCKSCTASSQCNDNNACTKDACSQKKCVHTKISGCAGPTDYEIVSLVPKTTPIYVPGGAYWKLTVRNEGKRYTGGYSGIMVWTLYSSADNKLDASDKKIYGTKWKGYNVGVGGINPKLESFVDIAISAPATMAGVKYVCVKLTGGGDKNLTNNTKCFATVFKGPEYKAVSLKVHQSSLKAGSPGTAHVVYHNGSKPIGQLYGNFWHSTDAILDDKDLKIGTYGYKLPSPALGKTQTITSYKFYTQKTAQPTHKYLCFRINTYQDGWKMEGNTKDNSVCAPIKLVNDPDITYSPNHLYFRSKGGKNYATVPYGGTYTCGVSQITNAGYGNLDGEFPIRCWVADTANWNYGTTQVPWKSAWNWKGKIGGKGAVKTVLGTQFAKLEPKTLGVKYLCADMNHDKKLVETNYNNRQCRKITVAGVDMVFNAGSAKLGGSYKLPQASTLTRGKELLLYFGACNMGNVVLANAPNVLKGRVLLSKDKTPSADDYVVKDGPATTSKFTTYQGYGKFHCGWLHDSSKKITLPKTLAAGQYFLIFELNYGKKFAEPMHNNLQIGGVTVL